MNFWLATSARRPTSVLRRRYFWFLAGFVTLLLLITSAPEVYYAYGENKAQIAALQLSDARLVANRISNFLDRQEQQLLEIDALPWESGLLNDEDRVYEYERLMKMVPAITEIEHVDAAGKRAIRVSRVNISETGVAPGKGLGAAIAGANRAGKWYGATYLREGNLPYVSMAVAVPGRSSGVTIGQVNLKFVTDVVAQIEVGSNGKAYIVDSARQLVAHPNLSLVLRREDISQKLPANALQLAKEAGSSTRGATYSSLFEAEGLEGGKVLSSAVYIEPVGWWVVVEQSYTEALKPVFATLLRTLGFMVVGLLFAFVASYLLARTLVAPILRLQQGAARIGAGDLATRIDIRSGDELGALAGEFNKMADQLRDYTTGLEQKVAEKTAELQAANRHKSEFLANMSHELRTPLNAVIGFSDALKEEYFGPLNEKQAEYVGDINSSGQHLLSLINDILDLSKIEAGKMELETSRFNVAAAIDNAIILIRERALRQNLTVLAEIEPSAGEIEADERKVKQVLINLLTNAVKFSYPGGRVRVSARHVTNTNTLEISVSDTGLGIAIEDQATIFEEFRQLHNSGNAKHEGTGLGLSLTRRLVELHGGRIWVSSESGRGATFTFELPAVRPSEVGTA
ncbi:MAG TPA: sensor histidine kinase [Usitatibacteraceae bacterium]